MYSFGSPGNRPFLTSAVHSCNTGYTLTGGTFGVGTNIRVCVDGGIWDGSAPMCQGELCLQIIIVTHVQFVFVSTHAYYFVDQISDSIIMCS